MRRWRGFGRALLVILLCIGVGIGVYFVDRYRTYRRGEERLQAVLVKTDQLDPDWRWEELYDGREPVPDELNGAPLSKTLVDVEFPPEIQDLIGDLSTPSFPGNRLLSRELATMIADELRSHPEAVEVSLKVGNRPHAYADLELALNPMETLLPHTQGYRTVSDILAMRTIMALEHDNPQEAAERIIESIRSARAIGEEPILISQLVHFAGLQRSVKNIEQLLGKSDQPLQLEAIADQLALSEDVPGVMWGLRGERAMWQRFYENLDSDSIRISEFDGQSRTWEGQLGDFMFEPHVPHNHAVMLEKINEVIKIASQPMPELKERLSDFTLPSQDKDHLLVVLLFPAVEKVIHAEIRTKAFVRCAQLAIAYEQFRLKHHRWPESPSELLPEFLSELPTDPYNGEPLCVIRSKEGFVIYALGWDCEDDHGDIYSQGREDPTCDVGIRLWDVNHRRLPPLPDLNGEIDLVHPWVIGIE